MPSRGSRCVPLSPLFVPTCLHNSNVYYYLQLCSVAVYVFVGRRVCSLKRLYVGIKGKVSRTNSDRKTRKCLSERGAGAGIYSNKQGVGKRARLSQRERIPVSLKKCSRIPDSFDPECVSNAFIFPHPKLRNVCLLLFNTSCPNDQVQPVFFIKSSWIFAAAFYVLNLSSPEALFDSASCLG